MTGTYDFRLVALSVVIAIFASYAALDLTGRIIASAASPGCSGSSGSLCNGPRIWSMHYIGMLAFRMRCRYFTMYRPSLYHCSQQLSRQPWRCSPSVAGKWASGDCSRRRCHGFRHSSYALHRNGCDANVRTSYLQPPDRSHLNCASGSHSVVALILAFRIRDEKRTSPRKVASA